MTVLLLSLLTACDAGYSNLPNIRTDRAGHSLINYLPITLKSKATSSNESRGSSSALSKLRKDNLTRLSRTSDAVSSGHEGAHTLTHAFITENAKMLEDRARKILKTRDSIAEIQSVIEEHCTFIPTGEDCKLSVEDLDFEVFSTAVGYLPSNTDWWAYEPEVAFRRSAGKTLNFQVTLTNKSETDLTRVLVRWNQDLSTVEESLHTRGITSTNIKEYNHTFAYEDNQTSRFKASGSINDSRYSISQSLNHANSELNEVALSALAIWSTPTEQGRLKIDTTADDNKIQALSSFDNSVDGGRYASMAENTFDGGGKLTSHRYCISNNESGCSMSSNWIQSMITTPQ